MPARKHQFFGAERVRAWFGRAFERIVGPPGRTAARGRARLGVPALIALALAGCNSQIEPQPRADIRPIYSDEELAKLPSAQRCRYLSEKFAQAISDPRADERAKKKTYQEWPTTMQKWGCEATFRVWKPES